MTLINVLAGAEIVTTMPTMPTMPTIGGQTMITTMAMVRNLAKCWQPLNCNDVAPQLSSPAQLTANALHTSSCPCQQLHH